MKLALPRLTVSLRHVAAALLGTWLVGLAVAAVQLSAWNDELVRVLLQIRADAVFRTRMAQYHETIPREWYRSKALSLLAASDKLQEDGRWMLFLPGSWRPFDDLRERWPCASSASSARSRWRRCGASSSIAPAG
jgi:type VI secretion system protein ImpL